MNKKAKSTLEKYKNILKFRNYANNTVKIYIHYVAEFLNYYKVDPYHIPKKEAIKYLMNYNYSSVSQQNQIISSIKSFYKEFLSQKR